MRTVILIISPDENTVDFEWVIHTYVLSIVIHTQHNQLHCLFHIAYNQLFHGLPRMHTRVELWIMEISNISGTESGHITMQGLYQEIISAHESKPIEERSYI